MMRYILLLLVFSTNILFGQSYTSSCTPAAGADVIYRQDVYRLALARLTSIQSPFKDSIEIPALYQDSIARALYAIENMAYTPLKDTILNLFGFKNFNLMQQFEADSTHILTAISGSSRIGRVLLSVNVAVSNTADFYNDWKNANYQNTANSKINYLVQRFGLIIKPAGNISSTYYYGISSATALNMGALALQFNTITGVQTSATTTQGYGGDGNTISVSYDADGVILKYRNGCGDCPAGCTYTTTWTFKVFTNTNCQVQNMGRIPIADGETAFQRVCSRGIVLPLSFFTIHAAAKNNITSINWKMTGEENIIRYEIERSANGYQFYYAGAMPVTSRYTNGNSYSWSDDTPFIETVYYRIKSISTTGATAYSSVVTLSPIKTIADVLIYPNPVAGKNLNLQINNAKSGYTFSIFSIQGFKIYSQSIAANSISFTANIQLPANVVKGSYVVVLQNNEQQFKKLIQVQ